MSAWKTFFFDDNMWFGGICTCGNTFARNGLKDRCDACRRKDCGGVRRCTCGNPIRTQASKSTECDVCRRDRVRGGVSAVSGVGLLERRS